MEREYKVKLTITHKLDFDHEYILDPRASIFLLCIFFLMNENFIKQEDQSTKDISIEVEQPSTL